MMAFVASGKVDNWNPLETQGVSESMSLCKPRNAFNVLSLQTRNGVFLGKRNMLTNCFSCGVGIGMGEVIGSRHATAEKIQLTHSVGGLHTRRAILWSISHWSISTRHTYAQDNPLEEHRGRKEIKEVQDRLLDSRP